MWIDEKECITKGRYQGEFLEEVASEDPSYLFWMLEEAELTAEERSLVEGYLSSDDEGSWDDWHEDDEQGETD